MSAELITASPGQIVKAHTAIPDVAEEGESGIVLAAPGELPEVGVDLIALFVWGWVPVTNLSLTITQKNCGCTTPAAAIDYLMHSSDALSE